MIAIHATKNLYAKLPALTSALDSAGAASRLHDDKPMAFIGVVSASNTNALNNPITT